MKAYPEYKNTGETWLEAVPAHWEVKRLGHYFTERNEKVSDKNYPALSVTMGGIVPQIDTAAKTDDGDNRKLVRAGDFVINSRSDRKGSSGLSDLEGSVSLISIVLKPSRDVFGRFSHWLLKSRNFQEEFYRWGTGIVADLWSTRYASMRSITMAMPPLTEQRKIAAFLDLEVAKIDDLIEEQRRLIALLAEKRQATISHAVTKGLNPNAKLKPSGIDWLGDVPEGWDVVPLSTYFRAAKGPRGQLLTKEYCADHEGDFPVYSGQTENEGVMGRIADYDFDTGENGVLFSTTVGAKAMSVAHIKGRFSLSQNCMIISPTRELTNVEFYFYHFQPLFLYFRGTIPEHMQASFRISDLYKFKIALPPIEEQRQISAYLKKEGEIANTLSETASTAISLLQERRSALISAAVTGKIDLRDFDDSILA